LHTIRKSCKDSIRIEGDIVKYWRQPLDRDRVRVPHGIIHIIAERCKGCGFCVEFCGYHPPEITDSSQCADCGLCALLCPDFAIYVESSQVPADDSGKIDEQN
jgi:2-oxoglutarate ferredoxin oxidoreductase subunit delta